METLLGSQTCCSVRLIGLGSIRTLYRKAFQSQRAIHRTVPNVGDTKSTNQSIAKSSRTTRELIVIKRNHTTMRNTFATT